MAFSNAENDLWSEQIWPDKIYSKTPLNGAQFSIRLLRLLPGRFHDPIRCKLRRTTLIDSPPYQALSYTWGDARERRSILVNGLDVLITVNLECALRNFRRRRSETLLWVDALCINQHDVLERSSQVREMGNIYGFAETVVVWLGPLLQHCDALKRVSGHMKPENVMDLAWKDKEGLEIAIEEVLCSSWWDRVWVVQEVCRARRPPVLWLSSDQHMSFAEFASVVTRYGSRRNADKIQTFLDLRARTRLPPRLRECRTDEDPDETARRGVAEDMEYLLDATRRFDATDPRDKIFALWTLVRGNYGSRMQPDYSLSIEEVYTTVTRAIIEDTAGLSILDRRWGLPPIELPSWVPDYMNMPNAVPNFPLAPRWQISPTSSVPRLSREQTRHIEVRGAIIGRLARGWRIAPDLGDFERREIRERRIEVLMSKIIEGHQAVEQTERNASDPASRTPVAVEAHLAALQKTVKSMEEDLLEIVMEMQPRSLRIPGSFILFLSEEGLRGIGSSDLLAGDLIAVLAGYESPCALRRCPEWPNVEEALSFHGRLFLHVPNGGPEEILLDQKIKDLSEITLV